MHNSWIWIATLVCLLAAGVKKGEACEQNVIFINTGCTPIPFTSYAAAWDTGGCCPAFECNDSAAGKYDLRSGIISASASGNAGGQVTTEDSYVLSGVSGQSPVTFKAHLRVLGALHRGLDTFARVEAAIWQGTANESRVQIKPPLFGPPYVVVDTTLTITVVIVPNTPFLLSMFLSAEAPNAYADFYPDVESPADGAQLAFSDLPPGSLIVSCQGYRFEVPVAVHPTSWSDIKSRWW